MFADSILNTIICAFILHQDLGISIEILGAKLFSTLLTFTAFYGDHFDSWGLYLIHEAFYYYVSVIFICKAEFSL